MEERFFLDRVVIHGAWPAIYKGVVFAIAILAHTAITTFTACYSAAPWTKFTLHDVVFQRFVMAGLS